MGETMQQWYITFHGGERHAWNSIHRFDLVGTPAGTALASGSLPSHIALRELRGFAFGPDGDLYVANAWKGASQVLRFGGAPGDDGRHPFRAVFVEQHHANPGLSHPFDVAFGPDGHLYVPSQDTNVVSRYYGPDSADGKPGQPAPHPPALGHIDAKHLMPGTFVPSARHAPDGVRAVRRTVFGPDGDLYVADRDADSVKRYDAESGALRQEYRHHHLTTPVHLAFRPGDGLLLAGSRDGHAVFAIDTASGDLAPLVAPGAGGLRSPGGLAFDTDGRLYVCSRQTRQILRFDATGAPDPEPFIEGLKDAPEFIALVDA
jgi:DNA-binding beta-propeller fold protein YncE